MGKIKALLNFLLRLAISEKIIIMLFVLGGLSLIMVHMTYSPAMRAILAQHDFNTVFSAQEMPFIIASFFSIVCAALIGSTSFWWVFKEFFKDETVSFFLMKPLSRTVVGFSLVSAGMLLIGIFVCFIELLFAVIAFFHTRSFYVYYLGVNCGVLWYTGCFCFFYFCYFYTVWRNPLSIIFALLIAGLGFTSMHLQSLNVQGIFMNFSLLLAQALLPPIDSLFTIAALKYEGSVRAVFTQSLPIFCLLYILSVYNLSKAYENKRKK